MPRDQRIDQRRWKFRKYFADTVGQIDEETGCFFSAEGRHVPSEILAGLQAYAPHHEARKCCVLTKPNVCRSKARKL